ncbi:MAG: ankyrin repeat domain-containing protein [Roseofilum sp. SBFL]|uniref:ankyrin repeat domain-containing protein n=1 Tax=Roseofilum sp. SBFL TaxID=2821496 RepID=UPI001B25D46E|nr:ankyrin repeat domain-containing protein [Roseofilum sp. SBFL]MBP0042421.1 ankyrin repeat domain-containing protein [Roseofilum sp. SBFL]
MKEFIIALIAGQIISDQVISSIILLLYINLGSYGDEDFFLANIFAKLYSLGLGIILALIFFFLVLSKVSKVNRKQYKRLIHSLILVILLSIFFRLYLNEQVVPVLVSTATFEQNIIYLKILAKVYSDLNVKDINGQTALIKATEYRRLDSVRELIKAGTDLNVQDEQGWTALMVAAYGTGFPETDNCELTELLIKAGADINIEDNWGNNALTNALSVGNTCSANLLQQEKDNPTTN